MSTPIANPPSPLPQTLHGCVRAWACARPQEEAAIEPGRRLTYTALCDAVDECAAAMLAAGIERGDRVATLAPPGLDFLVTFLATAAIGGLWVGLNPRHADPGLDEVVARIEPKLVFVTGEIELRDYRPWAAALDGSVRVVELGPVAAGAPATRLCPFADFLTAGGRVARSELQRRYAATRADDPCLIVFTSGSTGAPKGAMISHAALVGASRVQLREWPADPLRVLDNLPINHIGCVGDLCCYALVGGGTVVFMPRFDPAGLLDTIQDQRVTVWGQVPTMFQLTLDAPEFSRARLDSLQLVFWGGAHAPPQLVEHLRPLAPRLATSYGQTETVGSVTFTPADASPLQLQDTVGRVVEPYQIMIVDTAGQPVPAGADGEVCISTPFGMNGYWRDPQAMQAACTDDGWRRTGDLGALTRNGDLKLLGRIHDVFKSGGYNIHPPEIEAAISACPGVEQAAVIGVPDRLYGAVAVAFVVAAREEATPSPETLRNALRGRLANYKIPKRFVFMEALPRLPVGKVDKKALQEISKEQPG